MKKISIIGSGGAGKSTLARKLSSILNIPVYHLDSLFWKPGWIETERSKWIEIQNDLCKEDEWIMDGNYGGTMQIRLDASDTVIFLDFNRYFCLYRAVLRFVKYFGKSRPDMTEGCKEQLDIKFVKWIYEYPKAKKPGILENLSKLSGTTQVYILKNPKEVKEFLKAVGKN